MQGYLFGSQSQRKIVLMMELQSCLGGQIAKICKACFLQQFYRDNII